MIGTPADIADAMEEWMDGGAADGFNITPTHLPGGIDDFVDLVVPELQRRGGSARHTRARRCGRTWACRLMPAGGSRRRRVPGSEARDSHCDDMTHDGSME